MEAGGSEVGAKGRGANPNKAGLEEYASPSIAARMTREAAQGKWRIPPRPTQTKTQIQPRIPGDLLDEMRGPPSLYRPAELPLFCFQTFLISFACEISINSISTLT